MKPNAVWYTTDYSAASTSVVRHIDDTDVKITTRLTLGSRSRRWQPQRLPRLRRLRCDQ